MAGDSSPAGRQPIPPGENPARVVDGMIASRVLAAWYAKCGTPVNSPAYRQLADVAVRVVLNALEEGGYLAL